MAITWRRGGGQDKKKMTIIEPALYASRFHAYAARILL